MNAGQWPSPPAPAEAYAPKANAFAWPGFSVIAEIKRASPSKGAIADHPIPAWAKGLERGGAALLSVLTERTHFNGSLETLAEVRSAVSLPLLRKDFLLAESELDEAIRFGASAVLLIVAFAGDALLPLYRAARRRGLSVLLEVHDARELDAAFACDSFAREHAVLGINQRNLESLVVDPRFAETIVPKLPRGARFIVESGIANADDVKWARGLGAAGILVGEALARTADPGATLAEWLRA